MTRSIALLGSTGSIGRQTLEVARELGLSVAALTANKSVDLIEQQAREFCPRLAVLYDEDAAREAEKVSITRDDAGDFVVSGKALEKLVAMTNFNNDEAVRRFQYIWRIKGIDEKLKERGIKEGQTVHIGEMEFEYRE